MLTNSLEQTPFKHNNKSEIIMVLIFIDDFTLNKRHKSNLSNQELRTMKSNRKFRAENYRFRRNSSCNSPPHLNTTSSPDLIEIENKGVRVMARQEASLPVIPPSK